MTNRAASLISFTGSTDVGRTLFGKIGASAQIKRLGLGRASHRAGGGIARGIRPRHFDGFGAGDAASPLRKGRRQVEQIILSS